MNICIYGSARNSILEPFKEGAVMLGRLIAKRGYGLIFGGGKNGLMGLVAGGALEAGGHVTGIVPAFFMPQGVVMDNCTERIVTDTMHQRKALMEQRADAFIATPGGIGTYEELFEMITWRQLGLHSKPIVLFNPGGYFDPLVALLKQTVENEAMPQSTFDCFKVLSDPVAVMDYLDSELKK